MYNTYLIIKTISALIGVGALGKIPVSDRSRWVMYVYTCVYIILSIYMFNNDYFFIILILGILLGLLVAKICNVVQPKLDSHELVYFQKELSRMNTIYGMASIRNQQLEQLIRQLDKKYCDTNSDMKYLLSELSSVYSSKDVNGDYTKLCEVINNLIPLLNKPYMLYIDRNVDMFNQLVTKRDYKKAIKALKEFRDEYYFGDGFDKELNYFIELLEKGEINAISRVQQTSK